MEDTLMLIASLLINIMLLIVALAQRSTIDKQNKKLEVFAAEELRNSGKRYTKEVRFVDVRHCDQRVLDSQVSEIQASGFDFYKDGSGNGLLAFRKYTEIEGEGA